MMDQSMDDDRDKAITFGDVTVAEFGIEVGDNPACSSGCEVNFRRQSGFERLTGKIEQVKDPEHLYHRDDPSICSHQTGQTGHCQAGPKPRTRTDTQGQFGALAAATLHRCTDNREDIRPGLENAPKALSDMLSGSNFGKMIVGASRETA